MLLLLSELCIYVDEYLDLLVFSYQCLDLIFMLIVAYSLNNSRVLRLSVAISCFTFLSRPGILLNTVSPHIFSLLF